MADRRPLLGFLQVQEAWERDVLFALKKSQASSAAAVRGMAQAPGIGARARSAQMQMSQRALLEQQSKLWDAVGSSVAASRAAAAAKAIEVSSVYEDMLLKQALTPMQRDALLRSAQATARRNVENVTNRVLGYSKMPLSEQVYKTKAWSNGLLENRINAAIGRGASARDIANDVKDLINPNTPGGVKYAAMRLGRTENNNAFHATSVLHAQKTPWVTGVKWELSGSHPRPDECNEYAESVHYAGGEEGVWLPNEVPGKPHPNCLCFTTPVTVSPEEFQDRFLSGEYDAHIDSVMRDAGYPTRKDGSIISMIGGGSGTGHDPLEGVILRTRREGAALSRPVVAKESGHSVAALARIEMKGGSRAEVKDVSDALDRLTGPPLVHTQQAITQAVDDAVAYVDSLSGTYLRTRREAGGLARPDVAKEANTTVAKLARVELKGGTDDEMRAIADALERLGAPGVVPTAASAPAGAAAATTTATAEVYYDSSLKLWVRVERMPNGNLVTDKVTGETAKYFSSRAEATRGLPKPPSPTATAKPTTPITDNAVTVKPSAADELRSRLDGGASEHYTKDWSLQGKKIVITSDEGRQAAVRLAEDIRDIAHDNALDTFLSAAERAKARTLEKAMQSVIDDLQRAVYTPKSLNLPVNIQKDTPVMVGTHSEAEIASRVQSAKMQGGSMNVRLFNEDMITSGSLSEVSRNAYTVLRMPENRAILDKLFPVMKDKSLFEEAYAKRWYNYVTRKHDFSRVDPGELKQFVGAAQMVQENGTVMIAIKEADVETMLKSGRFKSQFETRTSNGAKAPSVRAVAETSMFDIHTGIKSAQRPIYGYVGTLSKTPAGPRLYGEIRIELKQGVRDRTTITFGDSLGSPTHPIALTGEHTAEEIYGAKAFGGDYLASASYPSSELALKQLENQVYVEAQIHGQVLIDDIAKIHVPEYKPSSKLDANEATSVELRYASRNVVLDDLAQRLKDMGYTVERYTRKMMN